VRRGLTQEGRKKGALNLLAPATGLASGAAARPVARPRCLPVLHGEPAAPPERGGEVLMQVVADTVAIRWPVCEVLPNEGPISIVRITKRVRNAMPTPMQSKCSACLHGAP